MHASLRNTVKQWLIIALSSVFPIMAGIFAWLHRAQIPLGDMLFFNVPVAVAVQRGTQLPAVMLQSVLGVHYPIPSYVITALLAKTSHWNIHYEMYTLVLLVAVGYGLLLCLLWREGKAVFWTALLPMTALAWTVNQDPNLYISIHSVWLFNNIFLLSAILLLDRPTRSFWAVLAAGICALFATFTLSNGALIFVVAAPLLWRYHPRWQAVLTWFLLIALTLMLLVFITRFDVGGITAYLQIDPEQTSPFWMFPVYYLALLGSLFSFFIAEYTVAVIFGGVGVVLVAIDGVYLYRKGEHDLLYRWGTLLAFALLSCGMMSYGRYRWGMFFSQRSHYITLTLLFWVSVIVMTVRSLQLVQQGMLKRLVIAGFVVGALFHAMSVLEIWYGKQWYRPETIATYTDCLDAYPTTGDTSCIESLGFAPPEDYIQHIDDMVTYRLGLYRDLP